MLGDLRAKHSAHLGSLPLQVPHAAVEHRHELQRRSGDDGGGSLATEEHGNLAEDIARTQCSDHHAVSETSATPVVIANMA